MRYMFTMMNTARIGVGVEGLAIGERAYQLAASYALERRQGRAIGADNSETSLIVEHPDIRRSLMTMRSYIEAIRCLLYTTAAAADIEAHGESEEDRARAADRVALMTPMCKAWSTDLGVDLASMGLQVHGGMGYVEEAGAAQHFRDIRIAPIYEGTNGIQAIDLVMRKIPLRDGAVVTELLDEIRTIFPELDGAEALSGLRAPLEAAVATLERTTSHLLGRLAEGAYNDALAGATPYLRMFGQTIGGWLMARSAVAAQNMLDGGQGDTEFLEAKLVTTRFYCTQLLPQVQGLADATIAPVDDLFAIEAEYLLAR